jgi:hypothetical protein
MIPTLLFGRIAKGYPNRGSTPARKQALGICGSFLIAFDSSFNLMAIMSEIFYLDQFWQD